MTVTRTAGNTPVRDVPTDYYPPGSEKWFEIPDGPDAGKKMFFMDYCFGGGEPQETVVFAHGNPESSYTWRHVRRYLEHESKKPLRVIAMDHIGFGLSDQADFEMVDMHHAENLGHLINALAPNNVTLVVHDWGGPIGIGAFLEQPERVRKLVVVNSTVFPIPGAGMTYANYPLPSPFAWSDMPNRVPDRLWGAHAAFAIQAQPEEPLALSLRYLAHQLITFVKRGGDDPAMAVWLQQFRSRDNVRSSKRMVRQTPVWGHGYRYQDARLGEQDNRAFYRRIQERLPQFWGSGGANIEVRGIWGGWDPLAKPSVIEQWRNALPQIQGHVHVLPGISHFIEEHEPVPIARAIMD
jgi:pimeloyl-ACP methyl ester carboxylesterase